MKKQKIAVVTGVSSGIGKEIAKILLRKKYFVIGLSRSKPKLKIQHWVEVDLSNISERNQAIQLILEKYTDVDLLINNAGRGIYESWENLKMDDLRDVFELNFFSLVELTKGLLPLLERKNGSVINISSVASKMRIPFFGGYCASKFAVDVFTETLRYELNDREIHLLNVMPGRISTGFSKRALGTLKHPKTPGGSANVTKTAKAIFKAYEAKKNKLVYPSWNRFAFAVYNLLEPFFSRLAAKKWIDAQ